MIPFAFPYPDPNILPIDTCPYDKVPQNITLCI